MSGPSAGAYPWAVALAVVAVVLFGAWALYIGYIGLAYSLGASTFGVAPSAPQAGGVTASPVTVLGLFVLLVAVIVGSIALRSRLSSGGVR